MIWITAIKIQCHHLQGVNDMRVLNVKMQKKIVVVSVAEHTTLAFSLKSTDQHC